MNGFYQTVRKPVLFKKADDGENAGSMSKKAKNKKAEAVVEVSCHSESGVKEKAEAAKADGDRASDK